MFKERLIKNTLVAGALGAVAAFGPLSNTSHALPIGLGFDLFVTQPGTEVDLNLATGGLVGIVPLMGVPIGPGETDTIVQRLTAPPVTFGPGETETIDIEIVELSLTSVAPVDIGGTFFDVFVGLGGPPPMQSTMDITMNGAGTGGTFTSELFVFAQLDFVEVGNPANIFSVFVEDQLSSNNGVWSATAPTGDLHNAMFPAGMFYPGIDPITGEKSTIPLVELGMFATHIVIPPMDMPRNGIPEPVTAALGMMGLGVLGMATRRRAG